MTLDNSLVMFSNLNDSGLPFLYKSSSKLEACSENADVPFMCFEQRVKAFVIPVSSMPMLTLCVLIMVLSQGFP